MIMFLMLLSILIPYTHTAGTCADPETLNDLSDTFEGPWGVQTIFPNNGGFENEVSGVMNAWHRNYGCVPVVLLYCHSCVSHRHLCRLISMFAC
jgi:hypothetical protein